jgi:hypothetical protein
MELRDPVTGQFTSLLDLAEQIVQSDSEEHKEKRVRRKLARPRKQEAPTVAEPVPMPRDPQIKEVLDAMSTTSAPLPRIATTAQLFADAPHLNQSASSAEYCVGPSDAKKRSIRAARNKANEENPCKKPQLEILVMETHNRIPNMHARPAISQSSEELETKEGQERLTRSVIERRNDLYPNTFSGVARVLRQAGRFKDPKTGAIRDFPPCIQGDEHCVVKKVWGWLCMSWMPKETYDEFISKGSKKGGKSQCWLCACYYVCNTVMAKRLLPKKTPKVPTSNSSSTGDSKETKKATTTTTKMPTVELENDGKDTVFQQHDHFAECPDGYWNECLLNSPSENGYEGVIGHIPFFNVDWFVNCRDETNGQMYLDHSAMAWQPIPFTAPEFGETNLHFQQGVGSTPRGQRV